MKGVLVLSPVYKRFCTSVVYRPYILTYKLQRYGDKVVSQTRPICKKVAVQLKKHYFDGKDIISVKAFQQSLDAPIVHRELMKYRLYNSSEI